MIKRIFHSIYFLALILLIGVSQAEEPKEESSVFNLGPCSFLSTGCIYAGSDVPGCKGDALVYFDTQEKVSIVPEQVTLDGVEKQCNPIYDQKILFMKILSGNPVVVTAGNSTSLYYIQQLEGKMEKEVKGKKETITIPMKMLSAQKIRDASVVDDFVSTATAITESLVSTDTVGADTQQSVQDKSEKTKSDPSISGGIVGLSMGLAGLVKLSTYIFAAVKPHNGEFGQRGSGIALIKFDKKEITKKEDKKDKKDSKKNKKKKKKTKKDDN